MAYRVTSGDNGSISFVLEPSLSTTTIKRSAFSSFTFNKFVGIAPSAISNGASGSVTTSGIVTGLSNLSPGAFYYQSQTTGAITIAGGSRPIGIALSATDLLLFRN